MRYLLDTNVISEPRKLRPDATVMAWFAATDEGDMYLSALTVGEIRRGIEGKRRRDPQQAEHREAWLSQLLLAFEGRIAPVDERVADQWGRISVPDPLPAIDGYLAATALVHDWVLVTRNTRDVERTGVRLLNPWEASS